MNGRIIADAIAVNPLAEFACKPKPADLKAVRVRGLRRVSGDTWSVAELSRNASYADESRKARVLAQQLEKFGVACQQMGRRVIVHDVALLGRLLAKVPT